MKLTILGTGNAVVTRCYNTCFIFDDNGKYFLVDGGGGNGILRQLEDANIPWKEIRDIFITHKHLDHLTGIIWMIRMICQNMKRGTYEGEANLYGHAEVLQMAHDIACMVLQPKEAAYMGDRLHLITVENGETREIIGHDVTFFDIGSTASKLEDINTSVMPITFLFIIAFFVVIFSMTSGSVDNTLMKVCSYIPFTSPMAMFTRICMSTVAWYEIAISIAILIVSTIGVGCIAAKIYRVGVLLYGTTPKIGAVIKAVWRS